MHGHEERHTSPSDRNADPYQVKWDRRLAAVYGPLVRKPTKMRSESWYPQSVSKLKRRQSAQM
jgi:hypothetical protein